MYRKNTASQFVCFQMLLTATGAVATGLSPAIRRCIDGTFAAGGGTVTEDGTTGSYKYAMTQADTNGNDISFIFSAATAMPVCLNIVTTACDPTNAATFGITDIDATISSRMATYTQPTGFLAATFPSGTIANQTNITGGTITTVTTVTNQLTAAAIATGIWQDATAGDFTAASSIGKSLYTSGNAPGAASGIALVGSNMGTITGALTAAQIATGIWQDATAGDFTTASSIGKSIYNAFTANTSVYTVAALANAPSGGLTGAQIATAVWTDTTAGDFTAALSVGKSVMNGVSLGTGLTVNALTTNNDKTGYALTAAYDPAKTAAQAGDAMTLTAGERNATADAFLNRDMSTGTDSGSPTFRTVRQALRFLRNKWTIAANTLTVFKEDDTATSWTSSTATTPSDPVTSSDPAG